MNALLRFNAEFQKDLWEEISIGRLIGMPIVIGLIAVFTWKVTSLAAVPGIMAVAIGLLTILWGSRMASDSVTEEVANHTWDVHRLSSQSATSLVLGKFLGGTIYSWYGAAIAVGISYYADKTALLQISGWCLAGLIAQSAAFFTALALRGGNSSRRVQNLIAQLAGLIAAITIRNLPTQLTSVGVEMVWFGKLYPTLDFVNALSGIVVAWFLIGGIRIVRRDLGSRDGPLGWIAFTICVAVFMSGFAPRFAEAFANLSLPADSNQTRKILYVAVDAFYVALLGNPGSYNRLARLYRHAVTGDLPHIWRDTMPWMAGYILCLAAAIYTSVTSTPDACFSVAALGFLLRDAIVLTGFRLRDHGRGSIAVFYFLAVWVAGPYAVRNHEALAAFMPTDNTILSIGLAWGEALIALVVFRNVFLKLAQSARPAMPDAA
jgi:hypothetical protein